MLNLERDRSVLLWGAERPVQFQFLGAAARLGYDVLGLCKNEEKKSLISAIHPKCKSELKVPNDFRGALVWAPAKELFLNQPLSEDSLQDLQLLREEFNGAKEAQKVILMLPLAAYRQLRDSGLLEQDRNHLVFFPSLVGFGDNFLLDGLIDLATRGLLSHTEVDGDFFPLSDALSYALSSCEERSLPKVLWTCGSSPTDTELRKGFAELQGTYPSKGIFSALSKMIHQKKLFSGPRVPIPVGETLTYVQNFFPSVVTPWERYFRDCWRIFVNTPDHEHLLHFGRTRTP